MSDFWELPIASDDDIGWAKTHISSYGLGLDDPFAAWDKNGVMWSRVDAEEQPKRAEVSRIKRVEPEGYNV